MKLSLRKLSSVVLSLIFSNAGAAVRYVDVNSANPVSPFTNWGTAATTIQQAIDVALAGDQILVTNGVYQTGARAVYGMSNRVAVTKPVTVQSVNGPAYTSIVGYRHPGTTNGASAIGCAYLTNGAVLSGFTLTNGATQTFDGVTKNSYGGGVWCESTNAVLTNCVLTGNSASSGGGAVGGTLNNCAVTANWASNSGGGASSCTLNNCTVKGNSAWSGGGAVGGTLNNCAVTGNSASNSGGGTSYCTLNNCTVTGNSVGDGGGGAYSSTLTHCTLTGNLAGSVGGGVLSCTLNNSIAYYNGAFFGLDNYSDSSTLNYCCTTPLPTSGTGNLSAEPQLASTSHLSASSPCRGAGSAAYPTALDLDGEPWASPPSMGCDEYWSGATGALSVDIVATYTNVAVGFTVDFQAMVAGPLTAARWDFGDGVFLSNRPPSHAWTTPGDYVVEFRAYNDSFPAGLPASVMVRVVEEVHYVALNSPNPLPPFTSWATAATNIQHAVDVAVLPGALVLVTNGVYETGATVAYGSNRVAVTKPVTVQSFNGPAYTSIIGYQHPGTTNGASAIRCAYLTNGAVLSGFTLTNGATPSSGGGVSCQSMNAVVTNCVLAGNSASYGGGASGGTLNNCTLTSNSATGQGGGAYGGRLNQCILRGNSAGLGGGVFQGTLNNCALTDNSADSGGGAWYATLNHCNLTSNYARERGGGAVESMLAHCIVYYNNARVAGGNYSGGSLNYCCTTPLPASGIGNISAEPQLASASHLSASSACRGAGSAVYAAVVDFDGEPWSNPPSIGCDEYLSGSVTGSVRVAIAATTFNIIGAGAVADFQALIEGRVNASRWDFGDGVVVSNLPYAPHTWAAAGQYVIELRTYNETYPMGIAATASVQVVSRPVHFVALNSRKPLSPYTNWASATTNIQVAVDAAAAGGLILVADGVYRSGAKAVYGMSNRLAVTKPVTVQSVHGPAYTIIEGFRHPGTTNGASAIRCAYLTNGAVLSGFTLTNGATQRSGDNIKNEGAGGVWCESLNSVVTNCVVVGNSAEYVAGGAKGGTLNNCTLAGNWSGYAGGGVYSGLLNNCTLTGNRADSAGGGAYGGTLNNCTLTGNWAYSPGGGTFGGTINNCIVYYNSAAIGLNYNGSTINFSCTTPLPTGSGNITNVPLFVNADAWADLRPQSNSPCINAGKNAYAASTDLDGLPRIVGGTVDMGAYEFQTPASTLSYAWLQQYGLPADGSADSADTDSDGMNNLREWRAGTVPTNSLSALRMLSPTGSASGITVSWESVNTRNYWLERTTNLAPPAAFSMIASNLPGLTVKTIYVDTNAVVTGANFYRVGVQP